MIKESHSDGSTTEYDYNAAGLLTLQKEVKADNSTRRQIAYTYDDAANIISENRSGVDVDKKDELVRYYYDKSGRLIKTSVEGVVTSYTYDLAGNMLSDGESSYSYDISNRLLSKTNSSGITVYTYDGAGNLVKENAPGKTVTYAYTAQGKLREGVLSDGQSSSYVYNAAGARIENVQVRKNVNAGKQNADLKDGSHNADYLDFLSDNRAVWQRAWESEAGSVHQNDYETVTRHYIPDYLSAANRDIMVIEDGSFVTRYAYDENGARVSAEFSYAAGTARGTANASGEYGENPQSDIASGVTGKVWYRGNMLGSDLFATDENGNIVQHTVYDAWGKPLTETKTDANLSGLENGNNFTGYTYDVTLELYFAQNRFYDAENHRFTQVDIVKGTLNSYVYCNNNPAVYVDIDGLMPVELLNLIKDAYFKGAIPEENLGAIVVIANLVTLDMKLGEALVAQLLGKVVPLGGQLGMTDEIEEELRNADPVKTSLLTSTHEIAQIVAAKEIQMEYGMKTKLEDRNDRGKEIDIAMGNYIWEVKPYGTSAEDFEKALNKYVYDYNPAKPQDEYENYKNDDYRTPGGAFATQTIQLYRIGDKTYTMQVSYMGYGKVGYKLTSQCGDKVSNVSPYGLMYAIIPLFKKTLDKIGESITDAKESVAVFAETLGIDAQTTIEEMSVSEFVIYLVLLGLLIAL